MPKGVTPQQIDDLVLESLRKVAADGERARIGGRAVRLAGPKNGECVYKRALVQALEDNLIADLGFSVLIIADPERDRVLQASMKRLIDKDLVFRHVTGSVQKRSYWVAID